jgi:Acetyltransferases
MEIVNAEIKHFDDVYKLICELENEHMNREKLFHIYEENTQNPNVYYLLAQIDFEIVGFVSVHIQPLLHHASRIAEIQELIVAENKRGIGIGEALFAKAKEISQKTECVQLEVCCNQVRTKSHNFYSKQGMKNNHYKFTLLL